MFEINKVLEVLGFQEGVDKAILNRFRQIGIFKGATLFIYNIKNKTIFIKVNNIDYAINKSIMEEIIFKEVENV